MIKNFLLIYSLASLCLGVCVFAVESDPWYKIKKIDDLKIKVFFSDYETSIKHLYFFHLKLMSEYTKKDKELSIYIYEGLNSRSIKRAAAIKKYIIKKHKLDESRIKIVSDSNKQEGFIFDGERIEVFMTRRSLLEIENEIASQRVFINRNIASEVKDVTSYKMPSKINEEPLVSPGLNSAEGNEVFLNSPRSNSLLTSKSGINEAPNDNDSVGEKKESLSSGSGITNNQSSGDSREVYLERSPASIGKEYVGSPSTKASSSQIEEEKNFFKIQIGTLSRLSKYNENEDTWGAGFYSKLTINNKSKLKFLIDGSFIGANDTNWNPEAALGVGFESIYQTAEVSTKIFYKTSYAQDRISLNFKGYEDIGISQEVRLKLFRNRESLYKITAFGDFSFSNNLSVFNNSNILTYGFKTEALVKRHYLLTLTYEKRNLRDIGNFGTESNHFSLMFSYLFR